VTLSDLLAHPAVRGVAIGACVDGSKWNPTQAAHAHCGSGRFVGWVCVLRPRFLTSANFIHELAHLVAKTDGLHDAIFERTRLELRKQYRKRPARRRSE
jgi:hypothetical protein